jgi:hypothetical protein
MAGVVCRSSKEVWWFDPVKKEVETLLNTILFSKKTNLKVITIISEMDYKSKAIYADSLVVISLRILGKNHKFYQFPNYLKQNFEQRQIVQILF